MRVLITGANGFLAGHLLAYLRTRPNLEMRSLTRKECDLSRDKEKLSSELRGFQPDRVFHLAGRINGSESELFRDNHLATRNLLETMRRLAPAARIVVGSTTAVYGHGGTAAAPLSEDQTAAPHGNYAESKYAAEEEALAHACAGGWIVIARMSNPVGSNMNTTLLCGALAQQIVEIERGKTPIVTLRDLEPKRDFISVRDCVRALWTLAESGIPGAVYNVASGESTAIADIVRIFLDLARVRPIAVRTLPSDEVRSSVREQCVSNARLRGLGWKPEETVRQAIGNQLDAERSRL